MSVQGKTALVTGAATGIGAAIAKDLASRGAHVFGADVAWSSKDEESPNVEKLQCDVADQASVQRCVADIAAKRGGVDILVNNAALAGAIKMTPFEKITVEDWTHIVLNNTLGAFLCSQAVAPHMRERKWGRIINLTSSVIYAAWPDLLHYQATKGAVATMTRGLAKELGKDGITVNAIAPGLVITKNIANNPGYTQEVQSNAIAARVLPREQRPEDLVGTCAFLASDDAAFMSGQILVVDGGSLFP